MPKRPLRTSDLTPRRRRLVATLQRLRYGRIERLLVRDGEPVIEAGVTQLVRRIKLKGQNGPHPAGGAADAALKTEVVELLDQLAAIGDGVVRSLTVIDGLPGDLEVEEEPDDDADAPGVSPFLPLVPPDAGAAIPVPGRRG